MWLAGHVETSGDMTNSFKSLFGTHNGKWPPLEKPKH